MQRKKWKQKIHTHQRNWINSHVSFVRHMFLCCKMFVFLHIFASQCMLAYRIIIHLTRNCCQKQHINFIQLSTNRVAWMPLMKWTLYYGICLKHNLSYVVGKPIQWCFGFLWIGWIKIMSILVVSDQSSLKIE